MRDGPGLPLTTGEGTVSRDSALALIDDANRWQAAYNRTRNELADARAECDRLREQLDAAELVFAFIAQEAKDGRLEVDQGVPNAPTFWLEVIERRARAVLAAATPDTPPKDSGGALGQTPHESRGGDS